MLPLAPRPPLQKAPFLPAHGDSDYLAASESLAAEPDSDSEVDSDSDRGRTVGLARSPTARDTAAALASGPAGGEGCQGPTIVTPH